MHHADDCTRDGAQHAFEGHSEALGAEEHSHCEAVQACIITGVRALTCARVDKELGGVLVADLTAHWEQIVHLDHHILLPGACGRCSIQILKLVQGNACCPVARLAKRTHWQGRPAWSCKQQRA